MTGTRIDKWLWAARFFKTRELASKACEMGRVSSGGVRADAKPGMTSLKAPASQSTRPAGSGDLAPLRAEQRVSWVCLKPAREVRVGDMLHIQKEGGIFEIEVLALSQQRGPASIAQTLYRETEGSAEARRKAAEERRLLGPLDFAPSKRPSKRDRRLIHSFSGKR